jgi:RHS repeat-associated protein
MRTAGDDGSAAQLIRYQFSNHVGSSSLELDERARVISYEEYSAYGSTTFQSIGSNVETPKRYRFTGKERDEENGFSYHGRRYYVPWLGRWSSCDPLDVIDSLNLYQYARLNPCMYSDPTGAWVDPELFIDNPNADPTVIGGGLQFKTETGRFATIYDEPLTFEDSDADQKPVPEKPKTPPKPPPKPPSPPRDDKAPDTKDSPKAPDPKQQAPDNAPPADDATTAEKAGAFFLGAAKGLAGGLVAAAGIGFVAGVTGIAASTIGLALLPFAIYGIASNWDKISDTASRLWEGKGTKDDWESAGFGIGTLLSIFGGGAASEAGQEAGLASKAFVQSGIESLADLAGHELAPAGGGRFFKVAPGNDQLAPGGSAGSNIKGTVGEEASKFDAGNAGADVIGQQVTLESVAHKGVRIRIDVVVVSDDGYFYGIESKFGEFAGLTKNQQIVIPKGGGWVEVIPRGSRAQEAGLPIGRPIKIFIDIQHRSWSLN